MVEVQVTHVDLQADILKLAHLMGWKHLHVRRTIGRGKTWVTATNLKGWPDLLLWSTRQPGRHIAVELKVPPDKLTPSQTAVLAELEAAGFEVYVWTPSDIETAASVLRRPQNGSV